MTVYAKSNPIKTIFKHTQDLIDNYELLKEIGYLNKEKIEKYDNLIQIMLKYHDFGKNNTKFQNKILKNINKLQIKESIKLKDKHEIPHEWLSIAFISPEDRKHIKKFNTDKIDFYTLIKYSIAFHHTRGSDKDFNRDDINLVITEDLEKRKQELLINYELSKDYDVKKDIETEVNSYYKNYFEMLVFFKGILHKCDYSASAEIEPEMKYKGNYTNDFDIWLKNKFTLRDYQIKAKNLSNKSVVLIASTGAGKTEYSINWLNGDKSFYLLGIRIAVNEMYKRFYNIFGDNVSLLHGEISYKLAEENDNINDYNNKITKARQFSYPITIATADQLVTSVFKYNSFELIYLIASYSKIVVDEIQSFSAESIACIVVFLKEIQKLGGKFLLMTATLPPFIKDEFKDLLNIEFEKPILTPVKRHKIKVIDSYIENNIETIKEVLLLDKKVLIICNTVKKAQNLYELLKEFNPNLLHSRFIKKDKKEKEHDIMDDAKNATVSLWISTQVVEASLDIDFDYLFTENSTVDSLFQRFGRCYRNREFDLNQSNIYIFKHDKVSNYIYDKEISEKTFEILKKYDDILLSEENKQDIINEIFNFAFIRNTKYYEKYNDYKNLLDLGFKANKSEAQELFRKITNTHLIIPETIYNKYENYFKDLLLKIDDKTISYMDRLRLKSDFFDFTISVQIYDLKKIKDFIPIEGNFAKQNEVFICKNTDYTIEKGLIFNDNATEDDTFVII